MAKVSLRLAVLALADDLSQSVSFPTAARSRQMDVAGSVRRMAGGRLRTVRRAGSSLTVGVTAVSVTPEVQRTIESWAGRTVLFRDSWGTKLYGTFFTVGGVDFTDRERRDVTFTISEMSRSEAA